jgi:RNA polymerase sigma-70 factor (ECF subfamily)
MTDTNNDFELVKSFINGNESSFNRLVLKYQDKIYWHARRMTGNHLDADEVVQEVLIVLYTKMKSFKFKSSLYTWIYRITATRSINFLRKRNLRQIFSIDEPDSREVKSREDIINDIEQRERFGILEKVLRKLPAKQREIFIFRNFEELSYDEISQITGNTVGGLKANYFHAMKKITELMKDEEKS